MNSDRKTVFLVDDDMVILTIGNEALAETYNVFTINSGVRLLKMLKKNIPDLILLDVGMPEMDGYETIKHLKADEETRDIPVIFLTARTDGENELHGLSLGAIDYITKPFSIAILLKRIELHLLVESQKRELINFNTNLQKMVEAKTKTVLELQNAVLSTFAELIEFRDGVTGGHIGRTQHYLEILINAILDHNKYKTEISTWNTALILQSAQLHDVGKIAIKDDILQKPGRLTIDEFESIKEHVSFGETVIEKIKGNTTEQAFLEQARVLVATHHEKWDGSGYPRGLKGEEIPLQGRLMAIVDVYDALISGRPYKEAYTHKKAVDIIVEGSGTHFDPTLVDIFLGVSDKFYEVTVSGSNLQKRIC